jgi:hypothetical protein
LAVNAVSPALGQKIPAASSSSNMSMGLKVLEIKNGNFRVGVCLQG